MNWSAEYPNAVNACRAALANVVDCAFPDVNVKSPEMPAGESGILNVYVVLSLSVKLRDLIA